MENKCGTNIDQTVEYYEKNATKFVESTINADVSELYRPFEELLTPGCRILDLGCGSGRDSKYFAGKGYDVVALDPSSAMCTQTKTFAHVPVYAMKAEEIQFTNVFDGIWACASLLHVPRNEQENTLKKIAVALKDNGILYASWKYGDQNREVDGRLFTNMTSSLLIDMIKRIPEYTVINMWRTRDVRNENQTQIWLNVLLRRIDA